MTESIWFTDALMRIHIPPEATGDRFALIEAIVPPGHMPPPHRHLADGEGMFVLEGELTLYTEEGETVVRPGESAYAPEGVPHTLRITSSGPARVIIVSAPAGFAHFLRAAGRPAEREALPVLDGPPDVALIARAAAEHGMQVLGRPGQVPADLVARA